MNITYGDDINQRVPIDYYKLSGYPSPVADEMVSAEFACDSFLPDFEHPARIVSIPLLKGTAVQHTRPRKSMKTIDIVGWFRNSRSKDIMYQLYHVNIPTANAPFPTDYLMQRRDYLLLETPEKIQYKVTFAATPAELKPVRGQKGKLIYPITMRFYYVDESMEMFL